MFAGECDIFTLIKGETLNMPDSPWIVSTLPSVKGLQSGPKMHHYFKLGRRIKIRRERKKSAAATKPALLQEQAPKCHVSQDSTPQRGRERAPRLLGVPASTRPARPTTPILFPRLKQRSSPAPTQFLRQMHAATKKYRR